MPEEDVARFEAATGALLDDLGYERAGPLPPDEYVGRARRLRSEFERDLGMRRARVPDGWETVPT
jgi:hypothetical protein